MTPRPRDRAASCWSRLVALGGSRVCSRACAGYDTAAARERPSGPVRREPTAPASVVSLEDPGPPRPRAGHRGLRPPRRAAPGASGPGRGPLHRRGRGTASRARCSPRSAPGGKGRRPRRRWRTSWVCAWPLPSSWTSWWACLRRRLRGLPRELGRERCRAGFPLPSTMAAGSRRWWSRPTSIPTLPAAAFEDPPSAGYRLVDAAEARRLLGIR